MRAMILAVLAAAAMVVGASGPLDQTTAQSVEPDILVTSPGDSVAPGASVCPDATKCTLRRAIELANADMGDGPLLIGFDPEVFPEDHSIAITVLATPLPPLTRADVTIDGAGAGVSITADGLAEDADGLVAAGDGDVLRNIVVTDFPRSCIVASAPGVSLEHVHAGGCLTGIVVAGAGATVIGSTVGFATNSEPSATTTAIAVTAPDVTIGDPAGDETTANVVGNATTGLQVGGVEGGDITGVLVARNVFGKSPDGAAAPVAIAVRILPPAQGVEVRENETAHASTGIAVGEPGNDAATGNLLRSNRFDTIAGLAIDLGGNGLADPNDPGDEDTGGNGLLNHPVFTRAVQSQITGTACGGCKVEFYSANHDPGSPNDYGDVPIAVGIVTADPAGTFTLNAPPVAPGQWIIALASDDAGNTSEFGPSTRVGAGLVQCGNVGLQAGWNLVGFFGADSLPLGNTFPLSSGPSLVTAIYHLDDGTGTFTHWFAETTVGRTLLSLQPGEAYWMFATTPLTLPGGFTLTVPLPVTLEAGWNEFVYIGAGDDLRDAFATIEGRYTDAFRWETNAGGGRWLRFGPSDIPEWARGFTTTAACSVYQVAMSEGALLTPLQP